MVSDNIQELKRIINCKSCQKEVLVPEKGHYKYCPDCQATYKKKYQHEYHKTPNPPKTKQAFESHREAFFGDYADEPV